ncbi:hypothetical protein J2X97_003287 [Epilithonimonas hungarica]|nr:hypothetical protein [Epilithonimonas hungarica]
MFSVMISEIIEQASNIGYTKDIQGIYNYRRTDIQGIYKLTYYVKFKIINN